MKKILWLCNVVIPEFADEYNIKKKPFGGWISGMYRELKKNNDIEISFVFPICDEDKLRDGVRDGSHFFSFHNIYPSYIISEEHIHRFCDILEQYKPDVVQIWGSEYAWCLEMIEACDRLGYIDRVLIYIQGIVSLCAIHYCANLPERYRVEELIGEMPNTIKEGYERFLLQGKNEAEALKKVKYVIGRTEWDRAFIMTTNPQIVYSYCREILREEFYEQRGSWSYRECEPYRIFVSQANYPLKGFHYLLWALPFVIESFPAVRVYVAGRNLMKTTYGVYIRGEIDRLKLNDIISFLDILNPEEMIEQYKKANVFVSASSIENSSNSVCEAMLIGTPVVASYVGGIPSIVEHRKNGLLYPETDINMLAFLICNYFSDRQLCENISTNAVKKAGEFVSKDGALSDVLSVYDKISHS